MKHNWDLEKGRLILQKSPFIRISQAFKDFVSSLGAEGVLPYLGPKILQLLERDVQRVNLVDVKLQMLNIEFLMLKGLYLTHNILEENGTKVAEDIKDRGKFCQIVSAMSHEPDEYMQTTWACTLAGELENPGSFSRSTIRLLREIDKETAEDFEAVCRFRCYVKGHGTKVKTEVLFISGEILSPNRAVKEFYHNYGITYSLLSRLRNAGLIYLSEYPSQRSSDTRRIHSQMLHGYSLRPMFHRWLKLSEVPEADDEHFIYTEIGATPSMDTPDDKLIFIPNMYGSCASFTKEGKELSVLCNTDNGKPIEGYLNTILNWASRLREFEDRLMGR